MSILHPARARSRSATALVAAVALSALVLVVAPASALAVRNAETLGPKPGRCGVGCWGQPGTTLAVSSLGDFTIAPLIVRPGDRVGAKVVPMRAPPTLTGWQWPFQGRGCRSGSRQCFFRAGPPTKGWVTVSVGWINNIGSARTDAVYAVVPRRSAVLQGYVLDEAGEGVGGVEIRMGRLDGPAPRGTFRVRTGSDGHYNAILKPGRYRVYPWAARGRKQRFRPAEVTRTVRAGRNARADFTIREGLKVLLRADQQSLPADGLATTTLNVRVERNGRGLENQRVALYVGRPGAVEDTPAPVVLCSASALGGRAWPPYDVGRSPESWRTVTTGADGNATVQLHAGTVPGAAKVVAWSVDGFGRLRTKDLRDTTDETTVTLTSPSGGVGLGGFLGELTLVQQSATPVQQWSSPPGALAVDLGRAATRSRFRDLAFSPVTKPGVQNGVLVTSGVSPPRYRPDGGITPPADALLLPYQGLAPALLAVWGSPPAAIAAGAAPELPTFTQWASGAPKPGWVYGAEQVVPAYGVESWVYFGWPYPKDGDCM